RPLPQGAEASRRISTRHARVRAPRRQPRSYSCARLLLPLLFLCAPLLAQTGGSGTPGTESLKLKAEARLVLVDAVVTGKKDEPIHGLTAKDFHVSEDGKEQTITAFQTRTGPATPGMSRQQHFVLLFDGRSSYQQKQSIDDQKWIQQAAAKFIADNAGPNRLMSIAYYSSGCMTIAAQFTADVGQLQHALGAWAQINQCPDVPELYDPRGDLQARYYAQLAKDLAHVSGHKALALFVAEAPPSQDASSAAAAPPVPSLYQRRQQTERNAEAYQDPFKMELAFRKADVSVYPVEAQSGAANPGWALHLADSTGGHELSHGNDVVASFDQFAREQDESYTLGYVPQDSPEGSCHELKVTVDRPDVKVRGRNLYCNVREITLASTNPLEAELENLAASPHAGQTAASASMPFFYETGGVARVDLALEIPAPVLDPAEVNGKLRATMDVLGLAYNLGGGVAARFGDTVRFDFDSRQQFDSFVQHPLHYYHQFEVAPGHYRFKLIFRTAKDRYGVVETPLTVDPFDAGQLGLSAIALSRDVQPISQDAVDEEIEEGKKPLIFRGNRIIVSGSDVLPKTGTAEAYFEIYEPPAAGAAPVQLTMHLRLLDAQSNRQKWDSGEVDLSALAKPGNRMIPVALKLPVSDLPPGTWRAELTVKDSAGGETARSMQFRTE
ncbi:MAG: VWA domain-containing protein, partial [Bryobacteraceae bacterium]